MPRKHFGPWRSLLAPSRFPRAVGTEGGSSQRTRHVISGPAISSCPKHRFREWIQQGTVGQRRGWWAGPAPLLALRLYDLTWSMQPPRLPSRLECLSGHGLWLAPGSRGHSRGLTRVQKACLRFGTEAGWGLSTPFLLLLSQGIKFQSQQLRRQGPESETLERLLNCT